VVWDRRAQGQAHRDHRGGREFITLLAGAAACRAGAAGERMRRIGVLMNLAAYDPEALGRITASDRATAYRKTSRRS
jgi:hypothetical protein